ncbi:hypothetical protein [Halorussus ruber]|uniref:hypothetical protein n=1 Tax=Halorussus ruber TaxID=1126238 RepID=UPI001092B8E5|nr:hypothetical protein [Halorussus ruber]
MAERHDPPDRPAARESETDSERRADPERETEDGNDEPRPQGQLRWVQLREPKHALELGRNGRVHASHFHERYDSWEVLLETYEGEV